MPVLKNKYFFYYILSTITIVLIASIVIRSLYLNNQSLQEENRSYLSNSLLETKQFNQLKALVKLTDDLNLKTIDDLKIISIDGNNLMLSNLIKKNKLLYFYDYQKSCNVCVDRIIEFLKQISALNGPENIILLTNIEHERDFRAKALSYNVAFPCFKSKQTGWYT